MFYISLADEPKLWSGFASYVLVHAFPQAYLYCALQHPSRVLYVHSVFAFSPFGNGLMSSKCPLGVGSLSADLAQCPLKVLVLPAPCPLCVCLESALVWSEERLRDKMSEVLKNLPRLQWSALHNSAILYILTICTYVPTYVQLLHVSKMMQIMLTSMYNFYMFQKWCKSCWLLCRTMCQKINNLKHFFCW
jgi:hypothetical protein